jgi:hypothetical protein
MIRAGCTSTSSEDSRRQRVSAGEFFTPRSSVRLLVEVLEPDEGRVYAPCCGSAGTFVPSEHFIEAPGGQKTDISIFGQESNSKIKGGPATEMLWAVRTAGSEPVSHVMELPLWESERERKRPCRFAQNETVDKRMDTLRA